MLIKVKNNTDYIKTKDRFLKVGAIRSACDRIARPTSQRKTNFFITPKRYVFDNFSGSFLLFHEISTRFLSFYLPNPMWYFDSHRCHTQRFSSVARLTRSTIKKKSKASDSSVSASSRL